MEDVSFLLNGDAVKAPGHPPTATLLDWLREERGLKGTKEGCNEGDCGACTVLVTELEGGAPVYKALNACILFLPQLHRSAVRTVEGVALSEDRLHPVQEAMVEHHASQCGFCTPGFVMSLVAAQLSGAKNHNDTLAGNLCRCTGYDPIVKAARAAEGSPPPDWAARDLEWLTALPRESEMKSGDFLIPSTIEELAEWHAENPAATLVGGATDVGLWVNKQLKEISPVCFVSKVRELAQFRVDGELLHVGAGVTLQRFMELVRPHFRDFAEMLRRFGSTQVRNAATIGGNIANGSPIGDAAPALIALGAELLLRRGRETRAIQLEDFFIAYGKQDRKPGEFVEAILIPRQPDDLSCHKLSKRFDQDISAVCGCFCVRVEGGRVERARLAFGGMAATPKRALEAEKTLVGQEWSEETVRSAMDCLERDFDPISDMRASAEYRMQASRNMLMRRFLESRGGAQAARIREAGE